MDVPKRDFFASLLANNLGSKVTYKKPDGDLDFWVKSVENIDLFQMQEKQILDLSVSMLPLYSVLMNQY
ncbi:MAG: hypothetical protein QM660_13375 [Dysgonomonas sp.]